MSVTPDAHTIHSLSGVDTTPRGQATRTTVSATIRPRLAYAAVHAQKSKHVSYGPNVHLPLLRLLLAR